MTAPPRPGNPDSRFALPPAMALRALVILTLLNLLNYLDRQVLPAVEESLRVDLHLADWQSGLLGTGFVVSLLVTSPLFGVLGDRGSRTRLIALGASVWSLATAAGAAARGFPSLAGARTLVGVGEAAYGTIAPSLLADYFPRHLRGRIFASFYAALPVGGALGYVLGGLINHCLGWRAAFLIAGAPGMLLALSCLRLVEPQRGIQDAVPEDGPEVRPTWHVYLDLWRNRLYVLTVLGYAASTFGIGGLAFWMPAFLTRARHLSVTEAPVLFGATLVVAGFLGSLAGGWAADRLLRRTPLAYLWVPGITSLLAVPACALALTATHLPVYTAATFLTGALVFASTGPVNAMLMNVVSPQMRASAIAASTVAIHLCGDAPSPYMIGLLSDRIGLARAVLVVPIALAVSGLIWVGTAWISEKQEPMI